jgi:hypothetical protein
MIEQPRLAALGIAIMIVGLLWMGAAYLWGGGSESADERPNAEFPATPVGAEGEPDTEDDGGPTGERTDRTEDEG